MQQVKDVNWLHKPIYFQEASYQYIPTKRCLSSMFHAYCPSRKRSCIIIHDNHILTRLNRNKISTDLSNFCRTNALIRRTFRIPAARTKAANKYEKRLIDIVHTQKSILSKPPFVHRHRTYAKPPESKPHPSVCMYYMDGPKVLWKYISTMLLITAEKQS